LLKNEDNILPLNKDELGSIALIGPSADVARLDGSGSSVVTPPYSITVKQGIENRAPEVTINYAKGCDINGDDTSGFPAAIEAASNSDVVVFGRLR
jgi:beta-glucosidase